MLHCPEVWGSTGGHAPLFAGLEVYGAPLEDMLHCPEVWDSTGGHAPLFADPEVLYIIGGHAPLS